MGPYLVTLLAAVLSFALIRRARKVPGNRAMTYSMLVAVMITFLLGLRHPIMGVDLGYGLDHGYLLSFLHLSQMSWRQIFHLKAYANYEIGYIWFNKLAGCICREPQFFMFLCAGIPVSLFGWTIGRYSCNCRSSWLIFFGLPVFLILFSGLRQGIAVALVFFGYRFIRKRQGKAYVLTVLLAALFHKSAICALVLYPLFRMRLPRGSRLLTIGMLPVVYALRAPMWNLLVRITGKGSLAVHSGSVELMLLFWGIYGYMVLFFGKSSHREGYLNLQFFTCCLMVFTEVSSNAQRLAYYPMVFLVLSIPEVLKSIHRKRGSRKYLLHYILSVGGFLLLGYYNLHHTLWAGALPYRFFWEGVL